MPAAHERWRVLPHDPIEHLADNLWRVEGDLEGPPVRRTMFVARLRDGRLVIHNAMALAEPDMQAIEAWGTPSVLVVPNSWHRLDARVFKERYPGLQVVCPEAARRKVEEVVPVDGAFGAFDLGTDEVALRHLPGVKHEEGVMEVRSSDGLSLLFNDLISNNPRQKGLTGLAYQVMAGAGRLRHHRLVALLIVRDRQALRDELMRLAALPDLRRVLVAHGAPVTEGAGEALQGVAAGL
jgi:hypothetical protein